MNIRQSVFIICKYFGNFRNNYLHQERAGGGQNNSAAVRLEKNILLTYMTTWCQLDVTDLAHWCHHDDDKNDPNDADQADQVL